MTRVINHSRVNVRRASVKAVKSDGNYEIPKGDDRDYLPPQLVYSRTSTGDFMPPQLMNDNAMNVHNPNPMDAKDSPAYAFMMFQQERELREQQDAEERDRYYSTIGHTIAAERAAEVNDGVQPADLPRWYLEPARRRPRISRIAMQSQSLLLPESTTRAGARAPLESPSTRNPCAADPRAEDPENNEESSESEEQGPAGNAASGSQRG